MELKKLAYRCDDCSKVVFFMNILMIFVKATCFFNLTTLTKGKREA